MICPMTTLEGFVREIEATYRTTPGLILSEDDLKCLLFARIHRYYQERGLTNCPSADPGMTVSPLHAEIKFLTTPTGRLYPRPDITLLEPGAISLNQKTTEFQIDRKGFAFRGSATAIEIKFFKKRRGIGPAEVRQVREDIQKLRTIKDALYPNTEVPVFCGLVVVFNRTGETCAEWDDLTDELRDDRLITLVHGTGVAP